MARVTPKYHKGETEPYAYNIRVFRGADDKGKELAPYQKTWRIPEGLKNEKRIKKALDKVVGEFETDCCRGKVSVDRRTVSEFAKDYLVISARDNKIKSQAFYEALMQLIDANLGHIRLKNLNVKQLNDFYLKLQYEDVRKDKKARAKDKLLELKENSTTTLKQLEQMSGLCNNTIRAIYQRKNVAIESAEKLADALGYPISELFEIIGKSQIGLSVKTITEYHRFIHTVLEAAKKEGCIKDNPADNATPPRRHRKEAEWFEIDDIKQIVEAVRNEPLKYQVMIHLLIETGMRKGELLALKWTDVDFSNSNFALQ